MTYCTTVDFGTLLLRCKNRVHIEHLWGCVYFSLEDPEEYTCYRNVMKFIELNRNCVYV